MIHVPREQVDGAGDPIRPNQGWFEVARKLTCTALAEGGEHELSAHYRHDQVRMALECLFHRKCAYCEAHYVDLVWNVEHFRPKGAVAGRPDHPGYYWLAYDWNNLYLACVFCNQQRKDPPTWGELGAGPSRGKLDQFPVADEASRAMCPSDDLDDELRLLLDPCFDEPELFLSYASNGEIHATKGNGFGKTTIRVCHLHRRRLRIARREKIERVLDLLALLESAHRRGTPAVIAKCQRLVADECEPRSPFAGVARALVADPEAHGVAVDIELLRKLQRLVSSRQISRA